MLVLCDLSGKFIRIEIEEYGSSQNMQLFNRSQVTLNYNDYMRQEILMELQICVLKEAVWLSAL